MSHTKIHVPPELHRPRVVLRRDDTIGEILGHVCLQLRLAGNPEHVINTFLNECSGGGRDGVLRAVRAYCDTEVQ